jgi:hypothetical protein
MRNFATPMLQRKKKELLTASVFLQYAEKGQIAPPRQRQKQQDS